jgi:hypothetical protein
MTSKSLFVVSIDSTREIDLHGQRIRRLEGVNSPTAREGKGLWRSYDAIDPAPPAPGSPLLIGWKIVDGVCWQATRTSDVVACFHVDPTSGPFTWAVDAQGDSVRGLVLAEGSALVVPTPASAHLLCCLANVGCAQASEVSRRASVWRLLPGSKGRRRLFVQLGASGATVGIGTHDVADRIYKALVGLPSDPSLLAGVFAACSTP